MFPSSLFPLISPFPLLPTDRDALQPDVSKRVSGVMTESSGNNGMALAWSASIAGYPGVVVIHRGASTAKAKVIGRLALLQCYNVTYKTHGHSMMHLWDQLPENYITLNPYNFQSLDRIGMTFTAIDLACKNHFQK